MILAFKIGFLEITFLDMLDILMFGILMYVIYRLLRGGLAFNILIGLFIIYLIWRVVSALGMTLLASALGQFIGVGGIVLVIIFQPEIRRFLTLLGKGSGIGRDNFIRRLFNSDLETNANITHISQELVNASQKMSASFIGAIMVLADSSEKAFFANTGAIIDAQISSRLLLSIFAKNSPLHDGAVVIIDNKIYAAGCVLPVSENPDLPSHLGLRHRAAVGISEQIDATVIIISEETGHISIAYKSNININVNEEEIEEALEKALGTEAPKDEEKSSDKKSA